MPFGCEDTSVERIADDLLATPVQGLHLPGDKLAAVLGEAPTLLVFLRHLG